MSVGCILFDLDGVLLDAREWHYLALNDALREVAGEEFVIPREEHLSFYDGLPTKTKLRYLTEKKGLPEQLHTQIAARKQELTQKYLENVKLNPVHVEMLRTLRDRGFVLGVCSNAVRSTVDMALEKLGIKPFFHLTISNEDIENPKPDPEIYQRAMHYLNFSPDRVLIVEDSEYGVMAAVASGARFIVVQNPAELCLSRLNEALV